MRQLKQAIKIAAVLGVAAFLAALVTEHKAIAQVVRAALVRNQDEPGRNPYSEQTGCFGSGCTVKLESSRPRSGFTTKPVSSPHSIATVAHRA